MNAHGVALVVISSAILEIFIIKINGLAGIFWIPLLSVLCLPMPYFSVAAYYYLKSEEERSAEFQETINSFNYILSSKGSMPLLQSVRKAIDLQKDRKAKAMLRCAYGRIMLGDDAPSAFEYAMAKCGCKGTKLPWNSDIYASIGNLIEDYNYSAKAEEAKRGSALQRYATLNMFLSAIAPSFIVFIFVGSTIVAGSSASMLAISTVLLVALPLAYSFGSFAFARRLIG